ncbi:MAG: pirin family protein, partial [Bacteroidia bacterium]
KSFADSLKINELTTLISPDKTSNALWINQDATFSMGDFEAGQAINYTIKTPGNGAYIFIIDGSVKINGLVLNKRDAVGVYDTSSLFIENEALTRLLIMDVPMV